MKRFNWLFFYSALSGITLILSLSIAQAYVGNRVTRGSNNSWCETYGGLDAGDCKSFVICDAPCSDRAAEVACRNQMKIPCCTSPSNVVAQGKCVYSTGSTGTNVGDSATGSSPSPNSGFAPSNLTYTNVSPTYIVGAEILNNTPTVTGQVTSYSISPTTLPAGLTFYPNNGKIVGIPTAAKASTVYTVKATNSVGSTTKALTIKVVNAAAPTALTYTNNSPTYTVGVEIPNNIPSNSGGRAKTVNGYSISPTTLPSGLYFRPNTGEIRGVPSAPKAATIYTVTVTNSGGSTSKALTIKVNPKAPSGLSYPNSNTINGVIGTPIATVSPTVTGTVALYSISPSLSGTGLYFAPNGAISGTPTAALNRSYTVTATNAGGSTTRTVTLMMITAAQQKAISDAAAAAAALLFKKNKN